MKNLFCYLSEKPVQSFHAGNKAREDIEEILKIRGYKVWIHVSQHEFYSLWRKISYVLSLSTIKQALFFIFAKGKDVIYQYPSCFNVIMNFFIRNSIPKNRSYLLIHDINSLRKENFVGLSEEIKVLNSAKVIISHNEQMTDILRQNGLKLK